MEKTLNVQRLLEAGFIDRFNDFTKRYEQAFKKNQLSTIAQAWIKNKDYDYIGHFLKSTHFELALPFTAEEFSKMDFITIRDKQFIVSERCKIVKEKEALYKEFQKFYD